MTFLPANLREWRTAPILFYADRYKMKAVITATRYPARPLTQEKSLRQFPLFRLEQVVVFDKEQIGLEERAIFPFKH